MQLCGPLHLGLGGDRRKLRATPDLGHWEADVHSGSTTSHVATLVERSTRFVILIKLDGGAAPLVAAAMFEGIRCLPEALSKTLTVDLGFEAATHRSFAITTKVRVFLCGLCSFWRRGGTCPRQRFATVQPGGTGVIASRLNTRLRKALVCTTRAICVVDAISATTLLLRRGCRTITTAACFRTKPNLCQCKQPAGVLSPVPGGPQVS